MQFSELEHAILLDQSMTGNSTKSACKNNRFHVFIARCTSAQRGIEIACCLSVRLSVRLSVCNVGGSGSHRLEILETNCTVNQTNTFALRSPKTIHLIPGELGEIWGRLGVGGVLENKSGNISETRKDRGKVTMESLQEVTNALSNGTIPDPLRPPLPHYWGFTTPPPNCNHYYLRNG